MVTVVLSDVSRQLSVVVCGAVTAICPLTPETWQLNLLVYALPTAYCLLFPETRQGRNPAQRDWTLQNEAVACTLPASPDSKMEVLAGMTLF
ncbi:MAG: hypothetical protein WB763_07335 [Terriglobia bacterium]|jgi:hypothetical protein